MTFFVARNSSTTLVHCCRASATAIRCSSPLVGAVIGLRQSNFPISTCFENSTEDGLPNDTMVAVYAAITGKTGNIADAYSLVGFDFSGMRQFDARTGSLADFKLTDKDHYELRIAVLPHDCGKVTTPVHIVEKPPSRKPSTTAFI